MMKSAADVPLRITSANSSSERRVTPSWTLAQLKGKLEPVTGIPAWAQRLVLRRGDGEPDVALAAADEEAVQLSAWRPRPYGELRVSGIAARRCGR
jgi:tubulin-folding cofactor B